MRPPRTTTPRWLVVIVCVAAALGVWVEFSRQIRRVRAYCTLATSHANKQSERLRLATLSTRMATDYKRRLELPQDHVRSIVRQHLLEAAFQQRMAGYHGQMGQRYQSAANRPWEPLLPEPEEPNPTWKDLMKDLPPGERD